MSDVFVKIKILFMLVQVYIEMAFAEWRKDVWKKDLDGYYCCNGNECGCYGASVREMYTQRLRHDR